MIKKRQINAFTLVEIITVIAIIGLLSVAALSYLGVARAKSRDARRVADVTQMKSALEMYFRDEWRYPDTFVPGESLVGTLSSTTYMRRIPSNIGPRTDGDCPDSDYVYEKISDTDYILQFCLGKQSTNIAAGYNTVTPNGIKTGQKVLFEENLVGWWDPSYNTSNTVILDKTNNNNNLTLYNGSTIKSGASECRKTNDYCMDFDGINDYGIIDITNTLLDMGEGEITVSLWIKVRSTPTIYGMIFRNMAVGGNYGYGLMTQLGTTNIRAEIYPNNNTRQNYSNSGTLTIDNWHLLTTVFERDVVRVYIDGMETKNYPVTVTGYVGYNNANYDPFIANYDTGTNGWYLNGQISDLRIYNRALTPSEILNIYNQTK